MVHDDGSAIYHLPMFIELREIDLQFTFNEWDSKYLFNLNTLINSNS